MAAKKKELPPATFRLKKVTFNADLLAKLLFPDGTEIRAVGGADTMPVTRELVFYLAHNNFPEIKRLDEVPETVIIARDCDEEEHDCCSGGLKELKFG